MGKTIIIEGRYDSATNKVVKDIMTVIKKTEGYPDDTFVHVELPNDLDGTDMYVMDKASITFNVEVNIGRKNDIDGFKIESFKIQEEDVLEFNMVINRNQEPNVYEDIYMKLQEDVRHEMEHILQDWGRGDRPSVSTEDHKGETTYQHHKRLDEVPALVQGFYRRAKKMRLPLDELMKKDLDNEIAEGNLTTKEAKELLRVWILYAKRRLPEAIYTNK
tara:strand:- start:349 stop:1002 length:654 start_codon:yes stop_codon:yes gene_type:complete